MAKSLVKRPQELIVETKSDAQPLWNPFSAASSFVSFTHSYSEVTSDGSRTHVKSTTTRLADGKLSKESFEGQLPLGAFGEAVGKAQSLFLNHAETLMRPWLSPFSQVRLPGKSKD
ncbi:MAG: hypothetical protein IPN53_12265 [Comamonadaceae bacterium]|nr:hypothetical protein [Comamonadaceae bacterium]